MIFHRLSTYINSIKNVVLLSYNGVCYYKYHEVNDLDVRLVFIVI